MTGSFATFVAARGDGLWTLAYLLVAAGHLDDDRRAEELLGLALARTRLAWTELERGGGVEAGVRRELVSGYLAGAGDGAAARAGGRSGDDSAPEVLEVLATLSPPQRVAVVLRGLSVPDWDAADALELTSEQLAALYADALAVASTAVPRAPTVLGGLVEAAPTPPYAAGRADRAERAAALVHRRRRLAAGGAALLVVALVAVPVLLGDGSASDRPSTGTDPPPPPPVAERLVDPLPIPQTCSRQAVEPDPPAYPYEVDGAGAVWLRFCPPYDPEGQLDAIGFSPDVTVTALDGVDGLVDGWVRADEGPPPCDIEAFADQGTVRMQVGTQDGVLHVVDMRISTCGTVTLDGELVGVDGRTAFAGAVSLLGDDLAGPVTQTPGGAGGAPTSCPARPAAVADLVRTTVADHPRIGGLPIPLPATSALVCTYPLAGPSARVLDREGAELLRAAYLARAESPRGCGPLGGTTAYAVVVTDRTGSRRAFTGELGQCGPVLTTGAGKRSEEFAGPWLTELLQLGAPSF